MSKLTIKRHKTSEKSFKCPYCSKMFSAKNLLEMHLNIHQLVVSQWVASQSIKKPSTETIAIEDNLVNKVNQSLVSNEIESDDDDIDVLFQMLKSKMTKKIQNENFKAQETITTSDNCNRNKTDSKLHKLSKNKEFEEAASDSDELDDLFKMLKSKMEEKIKKEADEVHKTSTTSDSNSNKNYNEKYESENKTESDDSDHDEIDELLKMVQNKMKKTIKNANCSVQVCESQTNLSNSNNSLSKPITDYGGRLSLNQSASNSGNTNIINEVECIEIESDDDVVEVLHPIVENTSNVNSFQSNFISNEVSKRAATNRRPITHPNLLNLLKQPTKQYCKYCNKIFNDQHSLRKHSKMHTNLPRSYKCFHCDENLAIKSKWEEHQKRCVKWKTKNSDMEFICKISNTPQNIYNCTECGRMFTQKSFLTKHMEGHGQLKNQQKQRKPKTKSATLENYENSPNNSETEEIEQDDPPTPKFVCNWKNCNKAFVNSEKFKYHLVFHNKENFHKTLRCSVCYKHFKFKRSLKQHMSEQHQIPQTTCQKDFNSELDLSSHLSNQYQEPVESNIEDGICEQSQDSCEMDVEENQNQIHNFESQLSTDLNEQTKLPRLPRLMVSLKRFDLSTNIIGEDEIKESQHITERITNISNSDTNGVQRFSSDMLSPADENQLELNELIHNFNSHRSTDLNEQTSLELSIYPEILSRLPRLTVSLKRLYLATLIIDKEEIEKDEYVTKKTTNTSNGSTKDVQTTSSDLSSPTGEKQLELNELVLLSTSNEVQRISSDTTSPANKKLLELNEPQEVKYTCTWKNCKQKFTGYTLLKYHLLFHKNAMYYQSRKCSLCDKFFKSKRMLNTHMMKRHKTQISIFKCQQCGVVFNTGLDLTSHLSDELQEPVPSQPEVGTCKQLQEFCEMDTKANHNQIHNFKSHQSNDLNEQRTYSKQSPRLPRIIISFKSLSAKIIEEEEIKKDGHVTKIITNTSNGSNTNNEKGFLSHTPNLANKKALRLNEPYDVEKAASPAVPQYTSNPICIEELRLDDL